MSDVLAVADHRRGEVRDVSFEIVRAGRELAADLGGDLHLAVIAGDVDAFADRLSLAGVDTIHTVDAGAEFNHDLYAGATAALFEELAPTALLMPNSVNGLDYAPAVANRLDLPLVADAVGLSYDGGLEATREMYGSKVATTVAVSEEPFAVTVRGGEWAAAEDAADVAVEPFDYAFDEATSGARVQGFQEVGAGDVDIADAEFLVSVGRGIEEEENLELIEGSSRRPARRCPPRAPSSTTAGSRRTGRSASPGSR